MSRDRTSDATKKKSVYMYRVGLHVHAVGGVDGEAAARAAGESRRTRSAHAHVKARQKDVIALASVADAAHVEGERLFWGKLKHVVGSALHRRTPRAQHNAEVAQGVRGARLPRVSLVLQPLRNGKQDERARSPRLDARGRANAKDEHHRREGRRVVVQVQGMRGHLRPRLVGDDAEEAEAHGGEGRVHSDLPHRVPARAHPGAECQGRCDQQGVVQHERNHSCVGILRKKIHTPRHVSNISTIFTDSTS